ncbi:methyltransferase domain-containing protein, partial [bacterium]|nr:methyltransferase domain-containing protein [bacterium]
PGEIATVCRYPRKFRPDIGEIYHLDNHSAARIKSMCPVFPSCPGCQLMHMSEPAQDQFVVDVLTRIWQGCTLAKLPNITLVKKKPKIGYRIRTRVRPLADNGEIILGMPSLFSDNNPIDLSKCLNHSDKLNSLILETNQFLTAQFDKIFLLRNIHEIRCHLSADEYHRIEIHTKGNSSELDSLPGKISDYYSKRKRSVWILHLKSDKVRTIFKYPVLVCGTETLIFPSSGRNYRVKPTAWTPIALGTEESLLRSLISRLSDTDSAPILEIGCGVGLLTIPLALSGHHVQGIDINRYAIAAAELNSLEDNLIQIQFRTGEAFHAVRKLAAAGYRVKTVVIHGMRKPYGERLFRILSVFGVDSIFLISPSISSWVSDVGYLISRGWRIKDLEIHDQIPQTAGFLVFGNLRKVEGTG